MQAAGPVMISRRSGLDLQVMVTPVRNLPLDVPQSTCAIVVINAPSQKVRALHDLLQCISASPLPNAASPCCWAMGCRQRRLQAPRASESPRSKPSLSVSLVTQGPPRLLYVIGPWDATLNSQGRGLIESFAVRGLLHAGEELGVPLHSLVIRHFGLCPEVRA